MTGWDKVNLEAIVSRIGNEAQTVEDMRKLILSEIEAYFNYVEIPSNNPVMYTESSILADDDVCAVGVDVNSKDQIVLYQEMQNNVLRSKYKQRSNKAVST